jgi:hypothetical protein
MAGFVRVKPGHPRTLRVERATSQWENLEALFSHNGAMLDASLRRRRMDGRA